MVNLIPARELGRLFGDLMHREQSAGEVRGLERLNKLILDRKQELEIKLGIIKVQDIPDMFHQQQD